MDMAPNFTQMERLDTRDSIKMMNIMDKARKYTRMEIIILAYGTVSVITIFFNMGLAHFIIKKDKLYIKEFGKTFNRM